MAAHKDLSGVESDFKIGKDDLDLRPIWHRLADRVKVHELLCMHACYVTWHMRQAWAPLTYADEHAPARTNPGRPRPALSSADAKAARKATAAGPAGAQLP